MANSKKLIYVGPNFRNHAVTKYSVFEGGLPKHIAKDVEKVPELKRLFVPLEKLEAAETDIKTKGTPLNKYYNIVKEVI